MLYTIKKASDYTNTMKPCECLISVKDLKIDYDNGDSLPFIEIYRDAQNKGLHRFKNRTDLSINCGQNVSKQDKITLQRLEAENHTKENPIDKDSDESWDNYQDRTGLSEKYIKDAISLQAKEALHKVKITSTSIDIDDGAMIIEPVKVTDKKRAKRMMGNKSKDALGLLNNLFSRFGSITYEVESIETITNSGKEYKNLMKLTEYVQEKTKQSLWTKISVYILNDESETIKVGDTITVDGEILISIDPTFIPIEEKTLPEDTSKQKSQSSGSITTVQRIMPENDLCLGYFIVETSMPSYNRIMIPFDPKELAPYDCQEYLNSHF